MLDSIDSTRFSNIEKNSKNVGNGKKIQMLLIRGKLHFFWGENFSFSKFLIQNRNNVEFHAYFLVTEMIWISLISFWLRAY